jgi:serine/threonine protein kinase
VEDSPSRLTSDHKSFTVRIPDGHPFSANAVCRSLLETIDDDPTAMAARDDSLDQILRGTPYRALEVLGRGGMGLVVAAEKVSIGRKVAVKVLHRDLAGDEGIVDRLRVEAQTLGRISSPHVVQVLDLGRTADGRPYLAMEKLEGRTLRDEIKEVGKVDPARALDIAEQALRGLGEAHALGVVHRDVKPENLFLTTDRGSLLVKVLDFGVAKVVRSGGVAPPIIPTDEGITVGTPRYLAPEQVLGQVKIDHRIDVYAMGLVLWSMLAGTAPLDDCSDAVELAKKQLKGISLPSLTSLVPGLPRAFDALVARATARDRDARFPDAEAFCKAIAAARVSLRAPQRAAPVQVVTQAMATLEPPTLDAATREVAILEPSTIEGPSQLGPPDLATVALPSIPTARVQHAAARPAGAQTLHSAGANRHGGPISPAIPAAPTSPAITEMTAHGGSWSTFAVVVIVTVVVLAALGVGVLFLFFGADPSGMAPVSSSLVVTG